MKLKNTAIKIVAIIAINNHIGKIFPKEIVLYAESISVAFGPNHPEVAKNIEIPIAKMFKAVEEMIWLERSVIAGKA